MLPSSQPTSAPDTAATSWHLAVASRLVAQWPLKAIGITAFMSVFFVAYFQLLNHPVFPVTIVPLTGLDRVIRFQPAALALYVSLWLYVSLPPALLETRRELIAYGWMIGGLCLFGMACFLFWPTAIPPVRVDSAGFPGFSMLKGLDAAGNACPSLHVATAVFSGLWLDRQLQQLGGGAAVRWINGAWCAGIVYSTLATKQHVVLDVTCGLLLGLIAGTLSLRRVRKAG